MHHSKLVILTESELIFVQFFKLIIYYCSRLSYIVNVKNPDICLIDMVALFTQMMLAFTHFGYV